MAATQDIVTLFKRVTNYGAQVAAGFQKNDLACNPNPIDEVGVKTIHGAVSTLSQLSSRVADHVEKRREGFSERGLEFARELALESGKTFVNIVDTAVNACLSGAERRALKKKEKEAGSAGLSTADILDAGLDEEAFLKTLEKGALLHSAEIQRCISRLHQIQLHLHLLDQVVAVAILSKDVSSGNIDIQNLVAYHKRIKRTASLVGIEPRRERRRWDPIDSDSSSASSDSDSDYSDGSYSPPRPPPIPWERNGQVRTVPIRSTAPGWSPPMNLPGPPPSLPQLSSCPPAPPPLNYLGPRPTLNLPGPPPPPPGANICGLPPVPLPRGPGGPNPPPAASGPFPRPDINGYPGPGPGLGSGPNLSPVPTISPPAYVARPSKEPIEKESIKSDEAVEIRAPVKPPAHEARLFRTKSKGFGFKLKSVFRSKDSLAEEMTRTLVDTDARLVAYVIQLDEYREIPHSAFHSLEATHMKTILSQLHNNEWYKTFVRLSTDEYRYLDRILHPVVNGQKQDRELVVLKVLHEERYAAELRLLNWIPRIQLYPNGADDRRLLAIVREKLTDGKPSAGPVHLPLPRTPPPPPMAPPMIADYNIRQGLTSFAEYIIRFRDHHSNGPRPLTAIIERLYNDQMVVRNRIRTFERRGGDVIGVTLLLTERQREHVNFVMQEIRAVEPDTRFEWHSVELSLHNEQGEICDFYPKGGINMAQTANIIHLIARRTLLPGVNSESVRHLLGSPPPKGYVGPQTGPPFFPAPAPLPTAPRGPVVISTPPCPPVPSREPIRVDIPVRRSSSFSTLSSTATCQLPFKSQVRKARKRRLSRERRAKKADDSDSESSWMSEPEDESFFVDLPLKKGDDVVVKLTELWTPAASGKGSS